MTKLICMGVLIPAFAMILAGCEKKRHETPPIKTDRIVSMAPNLTEILYAMGLGDNVVAVSSRSDFPLEVADKPKAGSFWSPDIEAIVAARPDLVVTLAFAQQQKLADRLQSIDCKCLTVNIETINDLVEAIEKIGLQTGTEQEASKLVETLNRRLENISSAVAEKDKPKVLWVVQREPLRVAGTDTFIHEMILLAGGTNAALPSIYKYPPIGTELLLAWAPDVIIEPAMLNEDLDTQRIQSKEYWSRYENLPAVKTGRIFVLGGDLVSRLGPRFPDGVELVARCLHPELDK